MISATVSGRLGKDPKQRTTPSGTTITELSVASDHGYGDRKTTTWVRVSIFGRSGDAAMQHLHKGSGVICTGLLYERRWRGDDGAERKSLELDRADWHFEPGGPREQRSGGGRHQDRHVDDDGDFDDNIPF